VVVYVGLGWFWIVLGRLGCRRVRVVVFVGRFLLFIIVLGVSSVTFWSWLYLVSFRDPISTFVGVLVSLTFYCCFYSVTSCVLG